MNVYRTHILALLFLCLAIRGVSEQTLEAIQRAKQVTALVIVEEADGTAEGSSFCIDSSGLFITNAHVVSGLKPGGRLMLVLHPGEADQVKQPANVVKMNADMDIAALQIAHPHGLVPLQLGDVSRLIETTSVVAFGYPFGTDLALQDGDYPNITVSTGHVTSLRKVNGTLAAIQLDASLNHGNSGGPIIDPNGQVIGIVAFGIPGSGINLAIPVTDLRTFLASLNIVFTPPVARAGHLHDKQEFRVALRDMPAGSERAVVEITLSAGSEHRRTVRAETADGRNYTAEMSLLDGRQSDVPDQVEYEIKATRAGHVISSEDGEISLAEAPAPASNPADRASVAAASVAGPYLYEGFNYASGDGLDGKAGGRGNFSSAWNENTAQGSTRSVITEEGLTFGNLRVSGRALMTTSDKPLGHSRKFAVSPGKVGGVLFLSYLVKPIDGMNAGYPNTYFGLDYGGLHFGKPGDHPYFSIDGYPGGRVDTNVVVEPGKTAFLVVRITFGAPDQNDIVDLFVNPTPGKQLPAQPDARMTDRNTRTPGDISFGGSIRCIFDEIRTGRTFAEVAPTK